jgi:hypothetical protein
VDMVRARTGRFSYREQLSDALEDFAALAVGYGGGRGLLVASPYQINRAAYDSALHNDGRYTLSALAETSMAERRSTLVLSLLALPETPNQLKAQVLKNRSGPTTEFTLDMVPGRAYVGTPDRGLTPTRSSAAALMGV